MKKNFKLSLNGCLMMLAIFSAGMNQTVLAKNADAETECESMKFTDTLSKFNNFTQSETATSETTTEQSKKLIVNGA